MWVQIALKLVKNNFQMNMEQLFTFQWGHMDIKKMVSRQYIYSSKNKRALGYY